MINIIKLNNDSSIPLYKQISTILHENIKSGKYLNGDKIPSEPQLCGMFNVSRITVRKSIEELQEMGLLVKKTGKGTYVSYPKIIESYDAEGSFTKSCELIHTIPSTKVISVKKLAFAELNLEAVQGIFKGENEIIQVERVRKADQKAMIYEVDYFFSHYNFIMEANLLSQPLMEVITNNTGLIAHIFEDMFDIKKANTELAELIGCEVGMPLLFIEQKVLTKEGELIYYNEQFVRQDLYKYVVRSRRY